MLYFRSEWIYETRGLAFIWGELFEMHSKVNKGPIDSNSTGR